MKRNTWMYPLRFDDSSYIEMMYSQIIHDYLDGLLFTKNLNGELRNCTPDQISKLAVCIYLTTEEGMRNDITTHTVESLVPSVVFRSWSISTQCWVEKFKSQLERIGPDIRITHAKALFLKSLSNWPLFGYTMFRLKCVLRNRKEMKPSYLAVGKEGVKLIEEKSSVVVDEWSYNMIIDANVHIGAKSMEMLVYKRKATLAYDFLTDESSTIARLVSQYTVAVNKYEELSNC
ncbi:hypothetical protein DICVIV_11839 [Dictyocaulus viviparus]|uniref:FERM domain-containing protein n=1 Tax=Dictyocaulus viviparus TaxID=29172 RepID=A0A0D8XC44_DICVI|nr:hypothetical protein DICVIV_11839 [Dictyocaulus viviparus]